MRWPAIAALALLCACPSEPCERVELDEPQPLVVADGWQASEAPDPLSDHRPEPVICSTAGWGEEFGVFEVRTEECNYLHAEQDVLIDVREGDGLRVRLWWQNLIASEPSEGHVALLVGEGEHAGEVLWEVFVDIPQPSASMVYEFDSPVSVSPGTPLFFHLHNHGNNSWTVAEVARVSQTRCGGS